MIQMTYKLRFKYEGTWTRWFNEGENLSWLTEFRIEAVQVHEEMSAQEFKIWYETKC